MDGFNMQAASELIYAGESHAYDLPDELLDIIFHRLSLDQDKRSLKSCTLVCRQWARVAYPHRFRRMSHRLMWQLVGSGIEEHEEFTLQDYMRKLPNTPDAGFDAAPFIQELSLSGGSCLGLVEFEGFEDILNSLTSLKVLHLCDIQLGTLTLPGSSIRFTPKPLDCLKLEVVTLKAAPLLYLLSLFSAVQTLHISGCTTDTVTEGQGPSGSTPIDSLVLNTSTFHYWNSPGCIPSLARAFDATQLRSLDIFASYNFSRNSYSDALRTFGRGLNTLTLGLSPSQTCDGQIDLSSSPELKTLHLVLEFPYKDADSGEFDTDFLESVWPTALRTAETAASSLRRLSICLQLHREFVSPDLGRVREKLARVDWAALECIVASRTTLLEVHISLTRYGWMNEVDAAWVAETEQFVREDCLRRFPRTRGMLTFSVDKPIDGKIFEIVGGFVVF